jgi:hypothetical protein
LVPDENLLQRLGFLLSWKTLFPELKEEELPRLARWVLAAKLYHLKFVAKMHPVTPQPTELSLATLVYGFRQMDLRQERETERIEALYIFLTSKKYRKNLVAVIKVMDEHYRNELKTRESLLKHTSLSSVTNAKYVKILANQFEKAHPDALKIFRGLAESVHKYIVEVIGPKFLMRTLTQESQSQLQIAEALRQEFELHFSAHKDAKVLARAWTDLVVHISLSALRKGEAVTMHSLTNDLVNRSRNTLESLDQILNRIEAQAQEELSTLAVKKREEAKAQGEISPHIDSPLTFTKQVKVASVKEKQINTPRHLRKKKLPLAEQTQGHPEALMEDKTSTLDDSQNSNHYKVELADSVVQSLNRLPNGLMQRLRNTPTWGLLKTAPWEVGEKKRKLDRDIRVFRLHIHNKQYRVVFRLPPIPETKTVTIVEIKPRNESLYKKLERKLN